MTSKGVVVAFIIFTLIRKILIVSFVIFGVIVRYSASVPSPPVLLDLLVVILLSVLIWVRRGQIWLSCPILMKITGRLAYIVDVLLTIPTFIDVYHGNKPPRRTI